MKNVLVLGAGKSSPYLIHYLLENAQKYDWFVTVADRDMELAKSRINNHVRGTAIHFDINDREMRAKHVKKADVVVNMLAPRFQHMVSLACVEGNTHMISVSYEDRRIRELESDAQRRGLLMLTEIGLDPGIDHMSAAEILDRIREDGGSVTVFESYGGGLPALDSLNNPLKYVISWNPRNVVMAGSSGAQYIRNGKIKIIPYHNVFRHSWDVQVEGMGQMEAYPNRDSITYQLKYAFKQAKTVIRATLRYPGWSETWHEIVRLGLPNEDLRIPNLKNKTYADLTEMFLPLQVRGEDLYSRVANFLNISPTGEIMKKLRWLGLFSEEKIGIEVETAAEVMTHLLSEKLKLTPDIRDMVVLVHKIDVKYRDKRKNERIVSTMIHNGERGGFTAMSKSVGLPAAIVAKLLLNNELPLTGCHIPTHPAIYRPVLKELAEYGLTFSETSYPLKTKAKKVIKKTA